MRDRWIDLNFLLKIGQTLNGALKCSVYIYFWFCLNRLEEHNFFGFSMANTITAYWLVATWYKKDPQAVTWSKVAICLHTEEKEFLKYKGTGCSNSSDTIITCCMLTREYSVEYYIQTQLCTSAHMKIDLRLKKRTD